MNKQEGYNNIEIFEKEFDNNFLLLCNNRTLSVGFLVRDILLLLQNGISDPLDIQRELLERHHLKVEDDAVERTISIIDKFTFEKSDSFFFKIGKLFDPSSINLKLNFLFNKFIFYFSFTSVLVLNIYFFTFMQHESFSDTKEWFIWLFLLMIMLFAHEMGHSLSAKKYGINCKEIGFGLYIIFPVLYTNLGESWKLEKGKRIIINLSGIYIQLIFGAIIGFLAWYTNSNIFSALFLTNLLIALLNLNPFIKSDGYWIAADLLNANNLIQAANKEITFNPRKKRSPKLLIYAILRLIFMIFMSIFMLNLFYSLGVKLYKFTPLSFRDYVLLVIIVFYIFKYLKKRKWTFKLKNKYS